MIETINKLIQDLPGYVPLEKPQENEAEQRYALAQMYAMKGFRDYMERAIRSAVAGFQHVEKLEDLMVIKGRVLVLKELYKLSRDSFNDLQKLEKRQLQDNS